MNERTLLSIIKAGARRLNNYIITKENAEVRDRYLTAKLQKHWVASRIRLLIRYTMNFIYVTDTQWETSQSLCQYQEFINQVPLTSYNWVYCSFSLDWPRPLTDADCCHLLNRWVTTRHRIRLRIWSEGRRPWWDRQRPGLSPARGRRAIHYDLGTSRLPNCLNHLTAKFKKQKSWSIVGYIF